MNPLEAELIVERIKELCKLKKVSYNAVANQAGMAPSTIYSIVKGQSKNPSTSSINQICDGLGINLEEFYDSSIFKKVIKF